MTKLQRAEVVFFDLLAPTISVSDPPNGEMLALGETTSGPSYSFAEILERFLLICALLLGVTTAAWCADYRVVYNFKSISSTPSSGLVIDAQGNAYGVTAEGGRANAGSVYVLSPTTGYHLLWPFSKGGPGGDNPQGNLLMDAAGNLYGTTVYGGRKDHDCAYDSCGVAFELSPPSGGSGLWTETVLYTFCAESNCTDGANPFSGLIFDALGNLYGTTYVGGDSGDGVVFELSPTSSGWKESVLHSFQGAPHDGDFPFGGLIFDASGNLYGTTFTGGEYSGGLVFELSPSGSGWVETILHSLGADGDGFWPEAGLALDSQGDLYGTTAYGGNLTCAVDGCGVVFELKPTIDGGWTESIIHTFGGGDGENPFANVILDAAGNVYGTTQIGGGRGCSGVDGCGTVFKLTLESNGQRMETFLGLAGDAYGDLPNTPVILDSAGNIYGTASGGGANSNGVVFRITQWESND
ncbi:MAG TPA: choice-of-anchor tandem repeat GloVer-containing protein [Terriglobales bacterium]|nr:choice-of-anchor tandem repeat GloVer-containing protein [Terriglobales bacterium]